MQIIPLQQELRLPKPNISSHKELQKFSNMLCIIDNILDVSGIESVVAQTTWRQIYLKENHNPTQNTVDKQLKTISFGLRCNIARHFLGLSYRDFSIRAADSQL